MPAFYKFICDRCFCSSIKQDLPYIFAADIGDSICVDDMLNLPQGWRICQYEDEDKVSCPSCIEAIAKEGANEK